MIATTATISNPVASTPDAEVANRLKTLRGEARKLIATTFLTPLMKQIRDSGFASDRFQAGMGEDAFGQQLDQMLSDRLIERLDRQPGGFGPVEGVYRHLARSMGGGDLPGGDQARIDAVYQQADQARQALSTAKMTEVDLHG